MDKQNKLVTVMVLDEQYTETFVIKESSLRAIKPAIIGLSALSMLLLAGLLALGWHYYQNYRQFAQQQAQTQQLTQQIEDLKEARSAEVSAKLNQLAQSEKAVAELRDYLRQRGANLPAPPAPQSEEGKPISQAGGPASILPPADTPEFSQIIEQLLKAARSMPLGRPAQGGLSSGFGPRHNPFSGRGSEFHHGLDFRGNIGDPVRVTANGTVEFAGTMNGYGQVVKVRHGYGYSTVYGHLSHIDVQTGQTVKAGELIGKLGSTGRSTGPHLHYEVRLNNEPHDPATFLSLAK
ncbi:M23 family metallopeptidase [Eikenella sp. S3360]|uniref:M23 family metallopeptidase n=1 Tax=Eikenella glucosivorans TaxID=2766967 RepID=A0ABS0N962_9NEIS|nr:M23 family metallopeptidase [Eikenella glucosivorans]MBH5328829.1 M23 family metallopeptidase [Eikenella glucosivorans]